MKLKPWQVEPANRLLDILRTGNAVDLSSTGVGKTAHAAHVIAELNLPTLVICPKIAVTSWKRMLEHFGTSATVTGWESVAVGKNPYGTWATPATAETRGKSFFICQNCLCKFSSEEKPSRCHATRAGIHCFVRKSVKHKRGRFSWVPQIKVLVFDEIHRAGSIKSLNAELVIAARRQQIKTLGLTATLATSPLGMRAVGFMLDLFPNPDGAFYNWTRRHSCGRIPALPGWHWKVGAERQADIMRNIHAEILPAHGVRLTTDSIPNFPTRTISVELFDAEKYETVDELYAQMATPPERTVEDATNELPIVQALRARMSLELFKVPIAVELCEDARTKGQAVAIFCSFSATIAELRKRLNCDCVIQGDQPTDERQRCIDDFQSGRQQIILVNSKAGGVACNLHDLCGRPRLGIVFPSYSAVEYLQVLGRLHRDGALSPAVYKVVLVAGSSTEESIKKALDKKLDNLMSLVDGDLIP